MYDFRKFLLCLHAESKPNYPITVSLCQGLQCSAPVLVLGLIRNPLHSPSYKIISQQFAPTHTQPTDTLHPIVYYKHKYNPWKAKQMIKWIYKCKDCKQAEQNRRSKRREGYQDEWTLWQWKLYGEILYKSALKAVKNFLKRMSQILSLQLKKYYEIYENGADF